jgi:hypothetical protein
MHFLILLDSAVSKNLASLWQINILLYYLPFASISSLSALTNHSLHLPVISVWIFPLSFCLLAYPLFPHLSISFLELLQQQYCIFLVPILIDLISLSWINLTQANILPSHICMLFHVGFEHFTPVLRYWNATLWECHCPEIRQIFLHSITIMLGPILCNILM